MLRDVRGEFFVSGAIFLRVMEPVIALIFLLSLGMGYFCVRDTE